MGFMKNRIVMLGAAVAAGLLFAIVGSLSATNAQQNDTSTDQSQGQGTMKMGEDAEKPSFIYRLNKKFMDYQDGVFKVRAGAGGHIAPMTLFFPSHGEIKVGETVVFYNPTHVSEPHTVTFIMDNSTFADFAAPFVIEGNTTFVPAVPNSNAEAIVMPGQGGSNVIVAVNNRSLSPAIIDSTGNATYLPPNANYTMTGSEKYVNSGWIWPKGLAPPGFPPTNSFSVTFSEEGTYNYICVVHPWMAGDIVVK
jgi:plastocyanin